MTAPDDSSVSYLCPQCNTRLRARHEDAGQRRECPQCGKLVKVPGGAPQGKSPTASGSPQPNATTSQARAGIANIPVVCPSCGTRMYATRQQVGQNLVCPDCLESVVVPDPTPPRRASSTDSGSPSASAGSAPVPPSDQTSELPVANATTGDEDDLRLSDPVELPRNRSVSRQLAELLDEHATDSAATVPTAPAPEPDPQPVPTGSKRPRSANEFAVRCGVCDTRIYASEADIGQERKCPDCYSPVIIKRPPVRPKRVNEVVEANYEGDDFQLEAPSDRNVYRPTTYDITPRGMADDTLRRAEQALDDREDDDSELPAAPLWNGLLEFLPDATLILRLILSGLLMGGTLVVFIGTVRLASGNAVSQFVAVAGSIATVLLTILSGTLLASNCLAILQESADGHGRVQHWPENSVSDWVGDAFPVGMAIFFAMFPGMVLFVGTTATGLSAATSWIFLGISVFVCFPIVQLSILESSSLTTPISQPILKSVHDEFLLWMSFYIATFFLGIGTALTLTALSFSLAKPLILGLGVVWALAAFLYFRLLGRLAWACQVRPLQRSEQPSRQDDTGSQA